MRVQLLNERFPDGNILLAGRNVQYQFLFKNQISYLRGNNNYTVDYFSVQTSVKLISGTTPARVSLCLLDNIFLFLLSLQIVIIFKNKHNFKSI